MAAVRAPITVVDTDDEELLQEPFSSDIEQKVEEEDATDAEEDEEDSMSESDSDGTTHLKLKRKRKGRHSGGSSSSENSTNNRKPNSRVRLRRRGGNDSSDEEKEVEEEEEEEQESSEPEPTRGRSNRRSSKRRTKTTALVTKKETSDSEKDDQEDEDEDDGQHSRSSSSIASSHPRRRTSSSSSALASTSKSSTSRSRSSSSKAATKKSSSRGISKRRGVSNSTSSSNEGDNNSEGGVEVLDGDDDVAAADGASEEENGEDDNNEEDEDEEEEDDDDSDEYEEYVSPKRSARLKKLQIASNQANQDSRSSSASSMSSSKLHTSASSASSVVASLFPFLNLPLLSISPADLSGADLLFGGGVGGMGSGIMNQPAGPANNNFFAFPNNNNNISCSSSSSSSSISTRKRGDLFYSESINLRDDSEDFFDFEMMIDEKVKSPPLRSPPPQLPSKYQEITSSSSFVIKSPVDAVACDQGHESTEMPVKLDKSLLELLPPRIPNAPPGIFMTSVDGAMLMVTWVTGYYQKRQKSPPSTTPSTVIATSASSVDDTLQPSSSSSSSSIPSTSSSTQIPLLRRLDNGLVNASLLLHAGGLRTESERSIVLSLEPHRVRYRESKILNGAWIPLSRAQEMARSFCMQDKVGVFLSDGLGKTLFGVEEVVVKPRLSAKTRKGGKTLMSKFEHLQEASPTTKDLMMAAPIMPLLPPLIGLPTSSLQQQQNISDKKDDSNCASSSSSSSNQQPAQPPTSTSSFTATATNATSNATSATPSTAALQQQIATNFFSQNPLAAQAFLSMIAGANLPLPNTAASALNVDPKARNKSTNIKLNSAAQLRRQQQAAKNLANSINNSMLVNPTFQSPLFNPLQSLLSNNVASSSSSSNNTSSSSSGASHFPFLLSHYTKAAGGISSLAGDSLSNYHSASASAPEKRFKRNPEVMKGMIKDG